MNVIYSLFDVQQMNRDTIESLIRYLPYERQLKALRYRQNIDKSNCVLSYMLLKYGLYKNYDVHSFELLYTQYGKPYLADHPNIHFNMSHCHRGCVCAISDLPIGIDIQDKQPFSWAIAERCCSEAELQLLKQSTDPASEFTKIWTMKESYLKMRGTGLTDNLWNINTLELQDNIKTEIINGCCISVACAEYF